jgi:hypothetical protein
MKQRATIALTVVLLFVASAFTCTQQQKTDAAKFADTYAQTLVSIHTAVDSSFAQGKLSPQEVQDVYKALIKANEAGLHLNSAIRGVAAGTDTYTSIHAAVTEAEAALDDGTLAIKNPTTQATVRAFTESGKTALFLLEQVYGGKQ